MGRYSLIILLLVAIRALACLHISIFAQHFPSLGPITFHRTSFSFPSSSQQSPYFSPRILGSSLPIDLPASLLDCLILLHWCLPTLFALGPLFFSWLNFDLQFYKKIDKFVKGIWINLIVNYFSLDLLSLTSCIWFPQTAPIGCTKKVKTIIFFFIASQSNQEYNHSKKF